MANLRNAAKALIQRGDKILVTENTDEQGLWYILSQATARSPAHGQTRIPDGVFGRYYLASGPKRL